MRAVRCPACGHEFDTDSVGDPLMLDEYLFNKLKEGGDTGLRRTQDLSKRILRKDYTEEEVRTVIHRLDYLADLGLIQRTPKRRRPVWFRLKPEDRNRSWSDVKGYWAKVNAHVDGAPKEGDWV